MSMFPVFRRKIIQRCREFDTVVITATQMMESMIENSVPTRAEVSDVANAVLDGTDAVMLSAETAVGRDPERVIKVMDKICLAAESDPATRISKHRVELEFSRIDEAIAMATMYTANHMPVKAIITLTESGSTPLLMSRISSGLPIFALTRDERTMGLMTLCRGVYPIAFDPTKMAKEQVNKAAVKALEKLNIVKQDDLVILTSGDHMGEHGGTNKMKIMKVGSII